MQDILVRVMIVPAGRLADMASQMGVSQATGPLGDLSKGVSSMASMLGSQVILLCRDFTKPWALDRGLGVGWGLGAQSWAC